MGGRPPSRKADAAAAQVAAHSLGIALLGRHLVAVHHLKGLLIDVGHEVGVKGAGAAHAVGGLHGLIYGLIAAEVHLEATLHPEQHLDDAVHIVDVGLGHVRSAVDKGFVYRYLTSGPLHRDVQRLFGVLQKGGAELSQGEKTGVQFRHVFYWDFNSKMLHCISPPFLWETDRFLPL